jgi:hypothetical protein
MFLGEPTRAAASEHDERGNAILLQPNNIRVGNGTFLLVNLIA